MFAVTCILGACGGFLLAVLWFDLMFDVQVLGHPPDDLPEDVLASIAGYYRRVTTTAAPMGHLVAVVMGATVIGAVLQLCLGGASLALRLLAFAAAAAPIGAALGRIVPRAARLGARADSIEVQSLLARSICRDHVACFVSILLFCALQLYLACSAS